MALLAMVLLLSLALQASAVPVKERPAPFQPFPSREVEGVTICHRVPVTKTVQKEITVPREICEEVDIEPEPMAIETKTESYPCMKEKKIPCRKRVEAPAPPPPQAAPPFEKAPPPPKKHEKKENQRRRGGKHNNHGKKTKHSGGKKGGFGGGWGNGQAEGHYRMLHPQDTLRPVGEPRPVLGSHRPVFDGMARREGPEEGVAVALEHVHHHDQHDVMRLAVPPPGNKREFYYREVREEEEPEAECTVTVQTTCYREVSETPEVAPISTAQRCRTVMVPQVENVEVTEYEEICEKSSEKKSATKKH